MALTLLHQDSLDRSNGGLNSSTFSDGLGAWASGPDDWEISSNRAVKVSGASQQGIVDDAMSVVTDQKAEARVLADDTGVIARSDGGDNFYMTWVFLGDTYLFMKSVAGGGFSVLGSAGGTSDGDDVLGCECVGTSIVAFVDAVAQVSVTNSTHVDGKCGMYAGVPNNTSVLDDFKVYTEQVAPTFPLGILRAQRSTEPEPDEPVRPRTFRFPAAPAPTFPFAVLQARRSASEPATAVPLQPVPTFLFIKRRFPFEVLRRYPSATEPDDELRLLQRVHPALLPLPPTPPAFKVALLRSRRSPEPEIDEPRRPGPFRFPPPVTPAPPFPKELLPRARQVAEPAADAPRWPPLFVFPPPPAPAASNAVITIGDLVPTSIELPPGSEWRMRLGGGSVTNPFVRVVVQIEITL